MEYLVGLLLCAAVTRITAVAGIAHGRGFYPTLLIVVASYYVLFAVMAAPTPVVLIESAVAAAFMLVALLGFRTQLWLVAAALVGHGLFDAVHHRFIDNAGVPQWWPGFCMAFDVAAGGMLALAIRAGKNASTMGTVAGR